MKPPAPPSRRLRELRDLTPARVALGRVGSSMPTAAMLDFTLAHARARDAVHAGFDESAILAGLSDLGLEALAVSSRARNRQDYLRRPDHGRTLDPESQQMLASRGGGECRAEESDPDERANQSPNGAARAGPGQSAQNRASRDKWA